MPKAFPKEFREDAIRVYRDSDSAYRANALFDAHRDDPEFGYRFPVDEAQEAGEAMAERTAWKICSELGWCSVFGKEAWPQRQGATTAGT